MKMNLLHASATRSSWREDFGRALHYPSASIEGNPHCWQSLASSSSTSPNYGSTTTGSSRFSQTVTTSVGLLTDGHPRTEDELDGRSYSRLLGPRRMPYRRRKEETKSTLHWGQRKLFLAELEFLLDVCFPTDEHGSGEGAVNDQRYAPAVDSDQLLEAEGNEDVSRARPVLLPNIILPRSPVLQKRPASQNKFVVYYMGAAPGVHLPVLARWFERSVRFVLYDPRDFHFQQERQAQDQAEEEGSSRTSWCENIEVRQRLFDLEAEKTVLEQDRARWPGSPVLLISDIRSADPLDFGSPESFEMEDSRSSRVPTGRGFFDRPHVQNRPEDWGESQQMEHEERQNMNKYNKVDKEPKKNFDDYLLEDLRAQESWVAALRPRLAMLKLRFPYSKGSLEYVDGEIRLPIFAPQTSTECRLVTHADAGRRVYDFEDYGERMFCFNTVERVRVYENFCDRLTEHAKQVCVGGALLCNSGNHLCREEENYGMESFRQQALKLGMDNCYDCTTEKRLLWRVIAALGVLDSASGKKHTVSESSSALSNKNSNVTVHEFDALLRLFWRLHGEITASCGAASGRTMLSVLTSPNEAHTRAAQNKASTSQGPKSIAARSSINKRNPPCGQTDLRIVMKKGDVKNQEVKKSSTKTKRGGHGRNLIRNLLTAAATKQTTTIHVPQV
ncbi:unnamed protein product [Amoebophrya sp. A25]|nr:unnamed protein product [Amoebophrya sp. A25]|eukprot:GSA25T00013729001.1